MKVLQHDELMDYLNKAIEIETDVAIQEKIIEEYEKEAEKRKPVIALRESHNTFPSPPHIGNTMVGIVSGVASIVFALLLFRVNSLDPLPVGSAIAFCMLLGGILLAGIPYMRYLNEVKSYRSSMASYNAHVENLHKENEEKRAQYNAAMTSWRHSYNENKNKLALPLKQTKEVMDEFYSIDVIYPKYRNLPALTSICEYFITGRCTELTGPHGAYNLYEDEVRKDMVISQLSMVIENLESIKNNQYMLYQQVKSIRENTDAMTQELRMIRGYTFNIMQTSAMTAYYSQITAKYTRRDYWFNN